MIFHGCADQEFHPVFSIKISFIGQVEFHDFNQVKGIGLYGMKAVNGVLLRQGYICDQKKGKEDDESTFHLNFI